MKKLPLLLTLLGIIAFSQADAWAQGTSLPPRGYVLPPPPGYNPAAVRSRPEAEERSAPPKPRIVSTNQTSQTKSTKSKTPTVSAKQKPAVVAKAKTPEKKPTVVAKSTKSPVKGDAKATNVAKSNKSAPTNSGSTKSVATTKRTAPVVAVTSKVADKPKTAEVPPRSLGESPRDLHAPATANVSRAVPNSRKQPVAPDATDLAPPVLTETAVTKSPQLGPPSTGNFFSIMPLTWLAGKPTPPATGLQDTPGEPRSVAAADHAASEMKLMAQALAAPPRAAVIEDLPLSETPPETASAQDSFEHVGGGDPLQTVVAKSPVPPPPVESDPEPSMLLPSAGRSGKVSLAADPEPAPRTELEPEPKSRNIPIIKPSMASIQPAAYRPSPAEAAPRTTERAPAEAEAFVSEAKFSAPDTPPPAPTKPAVKLSPSLGALSIDAERADSETTKNRVTFNGNVTMTCARFTLKADKLVANLKGDEGSGSGVQKVESEGHVIVNMNAPDGNGPGYIATGNQAFYDPEKETLRMVGWPKIEEGNKALVASSAATEILIDTKTGRLTTTGSTKTMLK